MTLGELKERGVVRVRRMEWAYLNQHVILDRNADGTYGATGLLVTPADEHSLGGATVAEIIVASLGEDDDRWEPWEPKG